MNYVMITGICGMVGSHLAEYLYQEGANIVGTFYKPTTNIREIDGKATLIECDVRYFTNVYDIINKYRPKQIYHLAAQSYPSVSWEKPQETMEINVTGTINLFESIRRIQQCDSLYDPVIVVACSSAEYGDSLNHIDGPADETLALLPLHPYGVSKVCQDLLTYQYFANFNIKGIRARIFNTTGPRKVNDICSDFTKQVVQMEKGLITTNKLRVGNLNTFRAITDVRDLVKALVLLCEKGKAGEVYNISGSTIYKMSDIVEIIREKTQIVFDVEIDKKLLRHTDEKIIYGNSQKLIDQVGWKQTYSLEETIKDMLDYWRRIF